MSQLFRLQFQVNSYGLRRCAKEKKHFTKTATPVRVLSNIFKTKHNELTTFDVSSRGKAILSYLNELSELPIAI